MATFYSDHFSEDGLTANSGTRLSDKRVNASLSGQGLMIARATIQADTANGDVLRLMTLRPSDRLYHLYVIADGVPTAGTLDLGLALSGRANDGAEIDDDLFASALAISSAIARVDEFTEAATLANADRGKALWQLANVGGASYTAESANLTGSWDVIGKTDTGVDAATLITVEAWFVRVS